MKRVVLFALATVILYGCSMPKYSKYENATQNLFDSIVSHYSEAHYSINAVALEEMFDEYHKTLKRDLLLLISVYQPNKPYLFDFVASN